MKKFISLLVALAILLTATLTVSATHIGSMDAQELGSVFSDAQIMAEFKALAAAQKNAVDAYDVLYNSFENLDAMTKIYPDNYGGAHIEDNILHIHIVDIDNQDLTPYQTLLADYLDDITFVDAEYSLETLTCAASQISLDLETQGITIVSYGVSETNNAVKIGVSTEETAALSDAAITFAQNYYTTLAHREYEVPVQFTSKNIPEVCTSVWGGRRLVDYTVGACGTYQGQPAFAMCGHGLSYGQAVYSAIGNSPNELIGTVEYQHFEDCGYGDYAVVKLASGATPVNSVGNPSGDFYTITGSIDCVAEGTYVVKYGARGGFAFGIANGMDLSVVATAPVNGFGVVRVYHLIEVDIAAGKVMRGDSGGPVINPDNVGEELTGKFCGVNSIADLTNNNGTSYDYDDDYASDIFYFTPFGFFDWIDFSVTTG